MANICDNTFYAYSEDQNNLKIIEEIRYYGTGRWP